MKQCTKGSSGVQRQEKTLYGRESLIVMAEHLKCISNTVVFTVQYWIEIIWLFAFKMIVFNKSQLFILKSFSLEPKSVLKINLNGRFRHEKMNGEKMIFSDFIGGYLVKLRHGNRVGKNNNTPPL